MERRVVVTGLGEITPLGTGIEKTWHGLCQGTSGIDRISRFDTSALKIKIGGEVRDFSPELFLDRKQIRRMDLYIQFAIAASIMAIEDAKLKLGPENAARCGVMVGSGLGGMSTIEQSCKAITKNGSRLSPFFIPSVLINMASAQIAMLIGAKGPNFGVMSACATGAHCIGEAFNAIQRGDADMMIAGAAEAGLTPLMFKGVEAMMMASTRNNEPQKASRPFDKDRDGLVSGEGAGVIVLEELESALSRGANIHAEMIGYGLTCDAYHITAPDPGGSGLARAMELALARARISPEEVDYINAHGSSTPLNDVAETRAIKKVFKEQSWRIPVSSIKSMIGHLWGAAGAVEAISTILSIKEDLIPPTINYETPDPECDLDYVPNRARRAKIKVALCNSSGFGGVNASLVFKRYQKIYDPCSNQAKNLS